MLESAGSPAVYGHVPRRVRDGPGGFVANRKDASYTSEETPWVRTKNRHYSQAEGRHEFFDKRAVGA
jgi:hypothetical protein